MHECGNCGEWCDCDGTDETQAQPPVCRCPCVMQDDWPFRDDPEVTDAPEWMPGG